MSKWLFITIVANVLVIYLLPHHNKSLDRYSGLISHKIEITISITTIVSFPYIFYSKKGFQTTISIVIHPIEEILQQRGLCLFVLLTSRLSMQFVIIIENCMVSKYSGLTFFVGRCRRLSVALVSTISNKIYSYFTYKAGTNQLSFRWSIDSWINTLWWVSYKHRTFISILKWFLL